MLAIDAEVNHAVANPNPNGLDQLAHTSTIKVSGDVFLSINNTLRRQEIDSTTNACYVNKKNWCWGKEKKSKDYFAAVLTSSCQSGSHAV